MQDLLFAALRALCARRGVTAYRFQRRPVLLRDALFTEQFSLLRTEELPERERRAAAVGEFPWFEFDGRDEILAAARVL